MTASWSFLLNLHEELYKINTAKISVELASIQMVKWQHETVCLDRSCDAVTS